MDVEEAISGGPCDNLSIGGATEQFRHITHKLQNVSPDLVMHKQLLMSFWTCLGPQKVSNLGEE